MGYILHFPKSLRLIPAHALWLKQNMDLQLQRQQRQEERNQQHPQQSNDDDDDDGEENNYNNIEDPIFTTKYLPLVTYASSHDDDETEASWEAMKEISQSFLQFLDDSKIASMHSSVGDKGGSILICDPTGVSISAGVLCMYLLLRNQTKIMDSLCVLTEARPYIEISLSLKRELEMLTRSLDEKKLKRLADRLKNSTSMSIAF